VAEIHVERVTDLDGAMRFSVRVREGDSSTEHVVSVSAGELDRLGGGYGSPDAFVHSCFDFLLEREPKESIMTTFDVSVIGGYFPEFERVITREG
jgi:hypothetical protein